MFYRHYLKGELSRRVQENPRYSLRAFSRALAIDASQLSRAISGKGSLSLRNGLLISSRLTLSPEEKSKFLESIVQEKQTDAISKYSPEINATKKMSLHSDLFEVMSNWYYPAILELTRTEGFRSDPAWIAKALGIATFQSRWAIEQLVRLGLLVKEGGKLRKSNPHMDTLDKSVSTPALRKLQKQVLQKAIHSLENDPIEERSVSSMTMAIDPGKLSMAKKLIEEFSDQLCGVLESGNRKKVYQFSVNLFPLQKSRRKVT